MLRHTRRIAAQARDRLTGATPMPAAFSGEAIALADWIASLPPTRSALRRVARNDERQKQTRKTNGKKKGSGKASQMSRSGVM
jgi:hypothetical protein